MVEEYEMVSLNDKQMTNFRITHEIYISLHKLYHGPIPSGAEREYWEAKVISAFAAQPFFNLPQKKSVLYTGKISENALKTLKKDRVNEHRFPRRAWLKWRLFEASEHVPLDEFMRLYWEEGGTYNITTKKENAMLEVYYDGKPDSAIYDGGDLAYREVGIELVDDPAYE